MLCVCYYNEMSSLINKKPEGIQRNGNVWPIRRKKIDHQKLSLKKEVTVDILEKDLKTSLKDTQETKGRCEESLKNDILTKS